MGNGQESTPKDNIEVPDIKEFVDRRIQYALTFMNCVSIGTIQSFDATKQTATISLNFMRLIKQGITVPSPFDNTFKDLKITLPLLINCPVVVLNGGGAFLSFPITPGDTALVLFSDRDIDTWYTTGGLDVPNSDRIHDMNDGIALVGIRNAVNPISGYDTSKSVWSFLTGLLSAPDKTGERLPQSGFLQPYAGSTVPSGWLLCYGQAVSRTTYANLFTAIGTTWGSGDGSTTFNLPDLRGRGVVGLDNMGGSQANVLTAGNTPNRNTLGGSIGEETHQLTIAEMPTHHHSNGASQQNPNVAYPGAGTNPNFAGLVNTGDTGGDGAHNNIPPGKMVNWLIKI